MNTHYSSMVVRRAFHHDLKDLCNLLEQLSTIDHNRQNSREDLMSSLRLFLQHPHRTCVLVAEVDGKIVGMVTAQLIISISQGQQSVIIDDMVIDAEYRHRGIGTELLAGIEEWVVAQGCSGLQLLTPTQNDTALDFYHKNQWEDTELKCLRKSCTCCSHN